jgi:hypothetical protein
LRPARKGRFVAIRQIFAHFIPGAKLSQHFDDNRQRLGQYLWKKRLSLRGEAGGGPVLLLAGRNVYCPVALVYFGFSTLATLVQAQENHLDETKPKAVTTQIDSTSWELRARLVLLRVFPSLTSLSHEPILGGAAEKRKKTVAKDVIVGAEIPFGQ